MSVWNMFGSNFGSNPGTPARWYNGKLMNPNQVGLPSTSPGLGVGGVLSYADLASKLNAFMTEQAKAPYVANLPNYQGMLDQATKNTGSQLKGEFTPGQIANFTNVAAERGIWRGMPGSQAINAGLLAEILNKTGELQQQGAGNLRGLIDDTPVPQLFNPASLIVPEHLANLELNAARAGRNSIPSYPSYRGYGPFTSGSGNSPFVVPSFDPGHALNPGAYRPTPGWTLPPMSEDDLFRQQLYEDEAGMDWTGYSPFGNDRTGYDDTFNWGPADWTMYGD